MHGCALITEEYCYPICLIGRLYQYHGNQYPHYILCLNVDCVFNDSW